MPSVVLTGSGNGAARDRPVGDGRRRGVRRGECGGRDGPREGGLAVVLPSLGALTVALAVLAWTGWLAFVRRTPRSLRQVVRGRVRWAILSSGAGALAFLLPLAGGLPFRPLVLALSLVPLW